MSKPCLFVGTSGPAFANIVHRFLENLGYAFDVVSAADDWASRAAAANPSAIVLELGFDDFARVRALRRALPDVPIVVMSAAYVGARLEAALLDAEREDVLAWVALPSDIFAPLELLGRVVTEALDLQRELVIHEQTRYFVTELVR